MKNKKNKESKIYYNKGFSDGAKAILRLWKEWEHSRVLLWREYKDEKTLLKKLLEFGKEKRKRTKEYSTAGKWKDGSMEYQVYQKYEE